MTKKSFSIGVIHARRLDLAQQRDGSDQQRVVGQRREKLRRHDRCRSRDSWRDGWAVAVEAARRAMVTFSERGCIARRYNTRNLRCASIHASLCYRAQFLVYIDNATPDTRHDRLAAMRHNLRCARPRARAHRSGRSSRQMRMVMASSARYAALPTPTGLHCSTSRRRARARRADGAADPDARRLLRGRATSAYVAKLDLDVVVHRRVSRSTCSSSAPAGLRSASISR